MKTFTFVFMLAAMAAFPCLACAQAGVVSWSMLDAGFATTSSGNTRVTSAVGQSFVGSASTTTGGIRSGFLVYAFRSPLSTGVHTPDRSGIPASYALSQNYPNPFNPSTTIDFALPRTSTVRLAVYNILGQEIALLVNEVRPAGYYAAIWDGKNKNGKSVSSGVYFFRLVAQDISGPSSFSQLKKMILLK